MRIVIDLQGAQTASRIRDIGRYVMSLSQAIVRNSGIHDIILALNALLPDTIEPIRAAFHGLVPQESIRVWDALGPVDYLGAPTWRIDIAEYVREAFIASLRADMVLIGSLFEGLADNGVTSIGRMSRETPTAVIFYDLIPYIHRTRYLNNPVVEKWYLNKFDQLRRADLLLSISGSSRQQAICCLECDERSVIDISDPADEPFPLQNIPLPQGRKFRGTPFWHEGVGLRTFEGISWHQPMRGDETSKLREVIGRENAFFDWADDKDITAKLSHGPADWDFHHGWVRHTLEQDSRLSWDKTAKRAISAMEQWHRQRETARITVIGPRPKLAYISPLPPEHSGISDYSAELLPELSRHFEIDVVVTQQEICDPYITAAFPIRTVEWFRKHADRYDRVLYHFGNSPFHEHMFGLLEEFPGVIVLHDFFLSHEIARTDYIGSLPNGWSLELYVSHGYEAVRQRVHAANLHDIILRYPCNLTVLRHAKGVIVHSSYSLRLAKQWYGDDDSSRWVAIPFLRASRIGQNKITARMAVGLGATDFVVCAFGYLSPAKLNHRLLQAWLESRLARDQTCRLIFVGDGGPYGRELLTTICRNWAGENIRITGWVDIDVFRQYLDAADIGIQLRTLSRGETSAAVFDCMSCGLATIVNAHGSMVDLDDDVVWKLPDDFSDAQLIQALETLWEDAELRTRLGARAREMVLEKHNPRACAAQYNQAIERFYMSPTSETRALGSAIAQIDYALDDNELITIAKAIAQNMPLPLMGRQLLLDISATCRDEPKAGIQRVAWALMRTFLSGPLDGFRTEPVYLSDEGGVWHYRYARRFTLDLLGCPLDGFADDRVEIQAGDILLGLDHSGSRLVEAERAGVLSEYRSRGVTVYFIVYDLLPLRLPQCFPPGADEEHEKWLRALLKTDGALCISRTVADHLRDWAPVWDPTRRRPFRIGWFHLGADIDSAAPSRGLPERAARDLEAFAARPTFLMVGTIEPRKGYLPVLAAFDRLWTQGLNVNLTIVGAQGWLHIPPSMQRTIPQILARLQTHPERGKRLFWVNACSDEYLEKIYTTSSCLIAASDDEGFGLPLIEAARHKLPIIARDIPIFREVAGDHAFYFTGKEPYALEEAIKKWLTLHERGVHPSSDAIPWITWKQSVQRLQEILLRGDWYYSTPSDPGRGEELDHRILASVPT